MSITVANVQTSDKDASGGTWSVHTLPSYVVPAGSDKILVVSIGSENITGVTISSVTHNGVALTQQINRINASGYQNTEIWDLPVGSSTPSGDIVVTYSGAGNTGESICARTLIGVAQQAPEATGGADSNTSPLNNSITTLTDNAMIVDSFAGNSGALPATTQGGQTTDYAVDNTNTPGWSAGMSNVLTTTAGSYTTGWSGYASRLTLVQAAYAPAGGGGSFQPAWAINSNGIIQ